MKKTKKMLPVRILIFSLLFICIYMRITRLAQPDWFEWNNYDTIHAFYKEPRDTIETVFLGSSVTANGIIPAQLYEEQGICAYNLGTEQQPVFASYYWMKEAYHLHSKTLKTVVFDVSMLRRTPKENFYRKALDAMHFSGVKYQAIKEHASGFRDFMSYMMPVLAYHDRWKSLTETDFAELNYTVPCYMRGYNITTEKLIDRVAGTQDILAPAYVVKDNSKTAVFDEQSLNYLEQMYLFCREHQLQLVLIKTPVGTKSKLNWTDSDHLGVQKLADDYGIEFLDFNYKPLIDEIGYDHANDSREGIHLNYYGAGKLTSWLGRYLIGQCKNTDVREDERYSFMKTELTDYQRRCTAIQLQSQADNSVFSGNIQGDLEE